MTRPCLRVDSGEYEMRLGVDGMRRGRWRGPADTADDESMFQAGIPRHMFSVINVAIMRCQGLNG